MNRVCLVGLLGIVAGGMAQGALAPAAGAQAKAPAKKAAQKPAKKKLTPAQIKEAKVDALWRRSDVAFHDGDYKRAIALHKQIVTLDPTDVESYGVAAWLMWSLSQNGGADAHLKGEAVAHLQRGIKANPKNWEMWNELAQHYDLQRSSGLALAAYQRALGLVPGNINSMMLRRRLAHAAQKAGDLQTSLATWRGLVRDFPNDPINKNNLARVLRLMNGGDSDPVAA